MERPNYPQDFFSFEHGVDITNEKMNEFIDEALTYLVEHPEEQFYEIAYGRVFIMATRMEDGMVDITVTKKYTQASIIDGEVVRFNQNG